MTTAFRIAFLVFFSINAMRWFDQSDIAFYLSTQHGFDFFWWYLYDQLGQTAWDLRDIVGSAIEFIACLFIGGLVLATLEIFWVTLLRTDVE